MCACVDIDNRMRPIEKSQSARKPHTCYECRRVIEKDTAYIHIYGVSEERGHSYQWGVDLCEACARDWQAVRNLPEDWNWELCDCFGQLAENIETAFCAGILEEDDPLVLRWLLKTGDAYDEVNFLGHPILPFAEFAAA